MKRSEIIISTGGLADRRRHHAENLRARFEAPFDSGNAILEKIQQRASPAATCRCREINARQALVIHGAQILENNNGTGREC